MTKEALKLALEALETLMIERGSIYDKAITAIKEALAQPEQEFTTHEEGDDGWSEWVCPDPKSYLMKCCDCGLVHEAQFGVVQYAVGSNEDCEPVVAQNVQAVFRMRRSEQWSPEDTAHRAGGLPMAQPEQEPVLWMMPDGNTADKWALQFYGGQKGKPLYTTPPQREWVGLTDEEIWGTVSRIGTSDSDVNPYAKLADARAIETKLKEKNT